jgi:hypothetical protein
METTTKTPAEQFAEDYLLIVENDQNEYNRLKEWANLDTYELAEYIKESFEEDMANIIGDKDTPSHWVARQMLFCWGIEPFILIARAVKEWGN